MRLAGAEPFSGLHGSGATNFQASPGNLPDVGRRASNRGSMNRPGVTPLPASIAPDQHLDRHQQQRVEGRSGFIVLKLDSIGVDRDQGLH